MTTQYSSVDEADVTLLTLGWVCFVREIRVILLGSVPERSAVVQCVRVHFYSRRPPSPTLTSRYPVVLKRTVLVSNAPAITWCVVLESLYRSEPAELTKGHSSTPLSGCGIQPDERLEPQRPRLHPSSVCFHDNSLNEQWAHERLYGRASLDVLMTGNRDEESEVVNRLPQTCRASLWVGWRGSASSQGSSPPLLHLICTQTSPVTARTHWHTQDFNDDGCGRLLFRGRAVKVLSKSRSGFSDSRSDVEWSNSGIELQSAD